MKDNFKELCEVLKEDERFVDAEGKLLKNKIEECGNSLDENLLTLLLSNQLTKEMFFTKIGDINVFDKVKFAWVINSEHFLPDSYTRFSQNIILADEYGHSIKENNDVVLEFPHKDCILEFDSTKEAEKRDEVYLNEILAKSEIDTLLAPKVFHNAIKHSVKGEEKVVSFSDKDNLVIKGNNLIVMSSLLPNYAGKIKLMYWDILYNTDSDKVPYNDSFKHSSWLTMMKNRLDIAKKLLSTDGIIMLQCSDVEMAYLKVLCDEVFNRNNYINTITIKTKLAGVSGSSEGKSFIDATEFILVFAKDKNQILFNSVNSGTPLLQYIQEEYIDAEKSWKYTTVLIDKGKREFIKEDKVSGYKYYGYRNTKTMSVAQFAKTNNITVDDVYLKHYDKIFRTTNAQSSVRATVEKETGKLDYDFIGLEYVPIKGKNANKLIEILYKGESRAMVTFLGEMIILDDGEPLYKDRISTIWTDIDYNNLKKEGGVELPFGKKPEKLIARIIELCSNEGDIVLDAYSGTGTTEAVAMKLHRTFIGIEQLDSHYEKMITRLNNVIDGDSTGVSEDYNWKGGGTYISFELKNNANSVIERINNANDNELCEIYAELQESDFVLYRVDINKMEKEKSGFKDLSLEDKRSFLIKIIDKNSLYVNYSDIYNKDYEISSDDKEFTKCFYEGDKE